MANKFCDPVNANALVQQVTNDRCPSAVGGDFSSVAHFTGIFLKYIAYRLGIQGAVQDLGSGVTSRAK